MKLTSQAVEDLTELCRLAGTEQTDNAVIVEGVVHTFTFDSTRIAENAETISALLGQLPDEFQATKGGGWSFLNACDDRNGTQWTGLHLQIERLFCLGIAAGKARWLMPRDMWEVMPGAMPYVSVN